MGTLSPDLAALNSHLGRQNRARREHLHEEEARPWLLTYRFAGDRPGNEIVHRSATPRQLVQFLRDHYPPTMQLIVVRIREVL